MNEFYFSLYSTICLGSVSKNSIFTLFFFDHKCNCYFETVFLLLLQFCGLSIYFINKFTKGRKISIFKWPYFENAVDPQTLKYITFFNVGKAFFLSSVQTRSLPLLINFFIALSFLYIENFSSTDLEIQLARSKFRFFCCCWIKHFFLFLTKLHLPSFHLSCYCSPSFSGSLSFTLNYFLIF